MKDRLNVLVLGVGGNVSQGILKALSMSSLPVRVLGACISPLSPGLYLCDKAFISPFASAPSFMDWLVDTCKSESVDVVLSGVEQNLTVMASHADELRTACGATTIVSKPEVLAVGDDKLATCKWLEANSLNYPQYAASEDAEGCQKLVQTCGFSLVAKPRHSRGGAGIIKIKNRAGLDYAMSLPDYVIEENLGTDDCEYTVGCFVDGQGEVRGTIGMRRELQQGTTYKAELGDFPEVRAQAKAIASALKPTGPVNVQMRIAGGRPVAFELNIRFSGTTPIRAKFGWNDVELAIRHFALGEPAKNLPNITDGLALRFWDELYVDPRAQAQLSTLGKLDSPRQFGMAAQHGQ